MKTTKLIDLPGKSCFIRPFLRYGWKTIEDVIVAIELNGISNSGYPDCLAINNHHPNNAGVKTWGWLFDRLDDYGYDWRKHITGKVRPDNVPREIEQLRLSIQRLTKAYNNMPDELRKTLFGG